VDSRVVLIAVADDDLSEVRVDIWKRQKTGEVAEWAVQTTRKLSTHPLCPLPPPRAPRPPAAQAAFCWAADRVLRPADAVHLVHVMVAVADRDLRVSARGDPRGPRLSSNCASPRGGPRGPPPESPQLTNISPPPTPQLDYFNQHDEPGALAAQQPMLDRRFLRQLRARPALAGVRAVVHLVQVRRRLWCGLRSALWLFNASPLLLFSSLFHTKMPPSQPPRPQASEDATTLGKVICRHADRAGAALVVMGSRRHSKLHGLLFGSASAYVEQHCTRPVRLVTEEEAAAAAAGAAAVDGLGV
jgi:hypothetical protein